MVQMVFMEVKLLSEKVVWRRLKRMIAKYIIKIISATLLTITPPLITLKT
tara:strand:- start:781 stop:930 length:150 start_codon:yes stop_codon:yes gene_type:complete